MEVLRGKAVEDAAIAFVIEQERKAGREAVDTRYMGRPTDVESPPRLIEVKAAGKPSIRGDDLWLETSQVNAARDNPDFYIYLVENVAAGDPAKFSLRIFGGEQLQRLLIRTKERRYFLLPLPVAEYDSAPCDLLTAIAERCRVGVIGNATPSKTLASSAGFASGSFGPGFDR